ncbi:MAG: ATP-binding protein, partial [Muribaculaceae bacterium]|nr:ATP-binding protein [Muribaculaceae bacterium]
MEEREILQCLSDQRMELQQYESERFVARKESAQIDLDSHLAQVVTGVRRSGKSTLCHMALRKKNVEYGYVNFDDDKLAYLKVDDLNKVLTCIYRLYGANINYLFFDEIQNIDGWHLFVSRLLRQGHKILITGSNAKLLSSELSTHLTGRHNEIRLFPFSFKEFCHQRGIDTNDISTKNTAILKNALDTYLMEGGFPELTAVRNKRGYIDGLVNTIINKDISLRYRIRNTEGLKTLANYLINNVAQYVDVPLLSSDLGIGAEKTVRNYIDHLSQAYL